jgi:hypothetical protein
MRKLIFLITLPLFISCNKVVTRQYVLVGNSQIFSFEHMDSLNYLGKRGYHSFIHKFYNEYDSIRIDFDYGRYYEMGLCKIENKQGVIMELGKIDSIKHHTSTNYYQLIRYYDSTSRQYTFFRLYFRRKDDFTRIIKTLKVENY